MSNPNSPEVRPNCVSDSPNTTVVYDDGDGDTTVRPIPPERLAQAIAERDRIREALQQIKDARP
jgi:hypothetical protein